MTRFLSICLGGAVGTGARYLLSLWMLRVAGGGFPWGTLTINLLGSFLLSLILAFSLGSDLLSPTLRMALTTGVLGGFTTYSTFNHETLQYFQLESWGLGFAYLGLTVLGCLAAGGLGFLLGRSLGGG